MAESERPGKANLLPVPKWVLILYAVSAVLAIIVLGLSAYGIHWIPYNFLIYALVVAICTLGVNAYMLGTNLVLHKLYNPYIALGLHAWMVIFWVVDMGLVASLARIWSQPQCTYSYWYGYYCSYGKRDLHGFDKRETTTYKTFYGTLAAGAFFAAAQFALWVCGTIITVMFLNKRRSDGSAQAQAQPSQPPPQYAPSGAAIPMEKYNQTAQPQQTYQQPYSATQTPQPQYAQPAQQPQGQYVQPPQPVYNQQNQGVPYPQDPIPRQDTVSPVSQPGYTAPAHNASELGAEHRTSSYNHDVSEVSYNANASELSTTQHTGAYNHPSVSELSSPQHTGAYNPNVSELSSQK